MEESTYWQIHTEIGENKWLVQPVFPGNIADIRDEQRAFGLYDEFKARFPDLNVRLVKKVTYVIDSTKPLPQQAESEAAK